MKTIANENLRKLRQLLGLTQAEFAAMIGASKDAVASWEIGRNKLSATFARRIACATGVDGRCLLKEGGNLMTGSTLDPHRIYTIEEFQAYRKSAWGRSDEEAARRHLAHCVDALKLIFLAAAKPEEERERHRLPGVLDAFMQWCEGMREDFQLGPQIDKQLEKRKRKIGVTFSYRQWRAMEREDPAAVRAAGFKDDPSKPGSEMLRLEMEGRPGWKPGCSMKFPKAASVEAVLKG